MFGFEDSLDFGLHPSILADEVTPELTGAFPQCNDTINYWLSLTNSGTTISSGIIKLELDDEITYISAETPPDSIIGQQLYWSYDSLFFFEEKLINIQVRLPDFTSEGDTVTSVLTTSITDGTSILFEDSDVLNQIVVCAFDPNDKISEPGGIGEAGSIPITTTTV